jgi:two-component system LytT family sensor kinase
MKERIGRLLRDRTLRHILFWMCWIIGFTFIKSFGESYQEYFGWFSYYIVTLPIFVSHTYLVAYVLIPRFFNRRFMLLFTLLFLILFYGFSVLELIVSNEFIYRWFPTGSKIIEGYLEPGNVIISGLGNLYIVLVFLAARTIRNWYLANNLEKELQQTELKQQMEETMTRIQPLMLLYAIDHIEKMVERSSAEVTRAIAMTSELLSEIMIYHEEGQKWISREVELVNRLVDLVGLFRNARPEVEFFISGDPNQIELPPMILFSFVDLVFRRFDRDDSLPELNIEASGFSNMISIQVLRNGTWWKEERIEECMKAIRQLEKIYDGCVEVTLDKHVYGCSVLIRKSMQTGEKTVHSLGEGVDRQEAAGA